MSTARTSTLAHLRGSIERIETSGDAHALNRVALGHAGADAVLRGGLAKAAVHEVFAEGHQSAAATGFIAGLAGRLTPRRPLVWVRQDFSELESGALSMSGLARTRPRSAPAGHGARRRCRRRVAHRRRRAGLRCARRCRAGSLGRGAAARSRRQPQTDFGCASLRRHRAAAAGRGHAATFDRGNKMDRARGAFAAGRHRGTAWGAPVFDAQLVRNRHGPVGRWIMEWKCDECLFSEPAAYPQPVAAAPAHRPHQAAVCAHDFKRSA